jgi:hypothetical protein
MIAAIVAVGVGGYAAYNYTTTGCVLGTCGDESASVPAASVQEVAGTDAAPASCDAMPACDGQDCEGPCPLCPDGAAVQEVAATTEAPACTEGQPECQKECTQDAEEVAVEEPASEDADG